MHFLTYYLFDMPNEMNIHIGSGRSLYVSIYGYYYLLILLNWRQNISLFVATKIIFCYKPAMNSVYMGVE